MKNLFAIASAAILSLFMNSCSGDSDQFGLNEQNSTGLNSKEVFKFSYNGKTYESTYQVKNDSIFIFDNKEAQTVYNNIMMNPNNSSYLAENGIVEYYDSYEDLKKQKGIIEDDLEDSDLIKTSPTAKGRGYCTIYFQPAGVLAADFQYRFNCTYTSYGIKTDGFILYNNGTTGRRIYFVLYTGKNFTGSSRVFICPPQDKEWHQYFWPFPNLAILDKNIRSFKAYFDGW